MLAAAVRKFDSPHGDAFTLLNAFDEWSRVRQRRHSAGGAGDAGRRGRRGGRRRGGGGSRAWCRRHGLIEQRLFEAAKLVAQFRQLLTAASGTCKLCDASLHAGLLVLTRSVAWPESFAVRRRATQPRHSRRLARGVTSDASRRPLTHGDSWSQVSSDGRSCVRQAQLTIHRWCRALHMQAIVEQTPHDADSSDSEGRPLGVPATHGVAVVLTGSCEVAMLHLHRPQG